jgi:hypothetical protein
VLGDEQRAQQMILEIVSKPAEVGIFVVDQKLEIVELLKVHLYPEMYMDVLTYFGIEV